MSRNRRSRLSRRWCRVPSVHVRGDSPALLTAALELVEVGVKVRVSLGTERRWPTVGVRDATGAVRALLTRIAAPLRENGAAFEEAAPVQSAPRRVLLRGKRGSWVPVPEPSVFGVPAVPASEETLAFLSGGAAVHAYLDRVRPPLTIGKTHEFGRLVRARMGRKLVDALVAPLIRERFGVHADEVEAAIAAPGLNEAMTRTGSLSGAVLATADRTAESEALVQPAGGWDAARASLVELLELYGAEFSEDPAEPESAVELAEADTPAGPLRAHGVVDIADPELPGTDADALQTVTLRNGEEWSVRAGNDRGWYARVAGPRSTERVDAASLAQEALTAAGFVAESEMRASWRAAPYIARDERDEELARIDAEREAHGAVLQFGNALHGDDVSAAVYDAAHAARTLRRQLTGIAE